MGVVARLAPVGCLLLACGGQVASDLPLEDAGDTGEIPVVDAAREDAAPDAESGLPPLPEAGDATGPECPDADTLAPDLECDPFAPAPGGCPAGEACYAYATPGADACEPSTFHSRCEPEGTGTQGTPCTTWDACAGDFVCVGTPYRCRRRCGPDRPCPDGLVCEGITDYIGGGACM